LVHQNSNSLTIERDKSLSKSPSKNVLDIDALNSSKELNMDSNDNTPTLPPQTDVKIK